MIIQVSVTHWDTSLSFLSLCWSAHCVYPFWVWWESLWPLLWVLYQVDFNLHIIKIFSEVLSCSFIWNLSLHFLILFDSLCFFLCITWNSYFSYLKRMSLFKWWTSSFNLPLALGYLLDLFDCPNCLIHCWYAPVVESVSRPVSDLRKEILFTT